MIKQSCRILALAVLPLFLIPAAQADTRFAVRIGDYDGGHHSRYAGKGHHGERVKHKHSRHDHGRRGHDRRVGRFNVSPRAYVSRDYDFGNRYVVIDRRHRHGGPLGGRFCNVW